MLRHAFLMMIAAVLAGCGATSDNFTTREKAATYDADTRQLTLPHPCPDWSQSQTENYRNEMHSNYGCAVNTNNALQVADPRDLARGHGDTSPNAEVTTRTVERYLAGEIPKELTPMQSTGTQ